MEQRFKYEKTWRFLQLPCSERKISVVIFSMVTAGMKISGRIHSGKEMLKDGFQIRAMVASIWLDFERMLFAEEEGWLVEIIIFLFTHFFVLFVWPNSARVPFVVAACRDVRHLSRVAFLVEVWITALEQSLSVEKDSSRSGYMFLSYYDNI